VTPGLVGLWPYLQRTHLQHPGMYICTGSLPVPSMLHFDCSTGQSSTCRPTVGSKPDQDCLCHCLLFSLPHLLLLLPLIPCPSSLPGSLTHPEPGCDGVILGPHPAPILPPHTCHLAQVRVVLSAPEVGGPSANEGVCGGAEQGSVCVLGGGGG
jgi:hypothetical protein